eukprot:CAMPEP_0173348732 /NCGR_PEP_ID=MMETSP1144-20121109/13907_1 /TAXON_ID=483371 /ORGANISM="non described non described, Strain CCMP2298" /LENGTH=97 /DNA_ID=CAMNT_0014296431 /DNA_START=11 /DNA_END=305 /DNA_ORIENTATION=+
MIAPTNFIPGAAPGPLGQYGVHLDALSPQECHDVPPAAPLHHHVLATARQAGRQLVCIFLRDDEVVAGGDHVHSAQRARHALREQREVFEVWGLHVV